MDKGNSTADLLVRQFAPAVLLSLKQVSLVTGQAEQTLRNLISQGRTTLPTRRIGGRRVVHVLDLAEWLEAQRAGAGDPLAPIDSPRRPGRPSKAELRRRG